MPPSSKRKKVGKERLDKYYHLAKSQGYRARSAFKLIQLNKKFGFLNNARVAIDLCAAPGGWLQVCSKYMPMSSIIVGVDLVKIKPIPNVITHAEDITSDRCRALLKKDLKDWKADVVMNDGAPNVGTAWLQDAFTQSELVLAALRLATEFLGPGGTFVTKIFRSKDYNNLMFVFNHLFRRVEATKPPSSRNVSAEIFVVCREYLAPKKIDPRFLDSKFVFRDVDLAVDGDADGDQLLVTPGVVKVSMQDLLNPEKAAKRRHRDGYKDGDYTLHAKHPVMEFIECRSEADATVLLAQSHEFAWEPRAASIAADDERNLAAIQQHKSTDEEMKTCLADLKVLGRREYKAILKWRKQMRKLLSLDADESKAEDPEEAADAQGEVFNEQAVIEEIEQRAEEQSRAEKRLERKRRQKMARDRTRLQLNMTAPMDIAMDEDSSALLANDFSMGGAELAEQGDDGDYSSTIDGSEEGEKSDDEALFDSDYDSDQEKAALREQEVDEMYADYLARKQDRDAKLKIQAERLAEPEFKGAAEDDGDDDSEMSGNEDDGSDASDTSSISSSDDSEAAGNDNQPMATSDSNSRESGAASLWFKNPVFEGMDLSEGEDTQATPAKTSVSTRRAGKKARQQQTQKQQQSEPKRSEDSDDSDNDYSAPAIDAQNLLSTAQAVDLAIKLVQDGGRNKRDLMDERGYNRYTFNDQDSNLPSWFVVDEGKHNRPQRPISKEAVQLLRQRQKEIDARPIKKVMEAKARKKYKANKKLESLRKKMNDMLEADGPDDPEAAGKLSQIDKTMRRSLMKAKKAEHKTKKLVVARGGNRALKGRPKGVKGRYKMVDSRMKKDQRDMKAKAKPKK